jgi:hypothetical protein
MTLDQQILQAKFPTGFASVYHISQILVFAMPMLTFLVKFLLKTNVC